MTPYERLLLPENLIYAWRKAKMLYRMADGYVDRAEIAAFELNLESELASIHKQFEKGYYVLKKLKPLPRPKKLNDSNEPINRQYFHISVRDQVAWIAVVNSIGPELDQIMPAWSYGNRLYRPIWKKDHGAPNSKLEVGPYRHASGHLYKKFKHSWPIFRRHISLTARCMANPKRDVDDMDYDEADFSAMSYADKVGLPYTKRGFWPQDSEKNRNLYYASIDLEKFYPNIKTKSITKLIKENIPDIDDNFINIVDCLFKFFLDHSDVTPVSDPPFEEEVKGIPTGLFVAGFLSNLALFSIDQVVNRKIHEDNNIAHFRFVDDHTILAYDFDKLCEWIKWYTQLLDEMSVGPKINDDKYDPPSLGDWINNHENKEQAKKDCYIDGRNPTKLLTKTLGQVSAIATVNIDILSDNDLEERLKHLEWLLLADIPDREMRPDTRAAFAAGQIAKLAPVLVQETNDLVAEVRHLVKLKRASKKNPSDENVYIQKIGIYEEKIKESEKEHLDNEQKRLHHCFSLLLQAFENHPCKARLFLWLLEYCRSTDYKGGLGRVAEWIQSERDIGHSFWADYYCGLTLHILADNLLKASAKLVDTEAMWSERNAAKSHIDDISNISPTFFSVQKDQQNWFYKMAYTEFAISIKSTLVFLKDKGCEQGLLSRLMHLETRVRIVSFQAETLEWKQATNYSSGVWAYLSEAQLSKSIYPSESWKMFENCFDYTNVFDRNSARYYPQHLSNAGWSFFLNSFDALQENDSGWLYEAIVDNPDRQKEVHTSENQAFKKASIAWKSKNSSDMRLSEWTLFIKALKDNHPFDPRCSEWTALEIVYQTVSKVIEHEGCFHSEDNSLLYIHPHNIIIPKVWTDKTCLQNSWDEWEKFVKEGEKNIELVDNTSLIFDYRYDASNDLGNSDIHSELREAIGYLLLGILRADHSVPHIWNIRGNNYTNAFPFSSILSKLAVSSKTLQILEGCLTSRSEENIVIKKMPSLFGWLDDQDPNDTEFDPPLLLDLKDILEEIKNAQINLIRNRISVSGNKPRQLIPVKIEGLAIIRAFDGSEINDGE